MNRLLDIGFEPAGHWLLQDNLLVFELSRHSSQRNILYAFTCNGQVKYVGKTVQPLYSRMSGYKTPGQTQSTNIRNHERILALLRSGAAVEILALPDNGLLHYGQFHLNLAAGLEDNIIQLLAPEWNGGERANGSIPSSKKSDLEDLKLTRHEESPVQSMEGTAEDRDATPQPIDTFTLDLQLTYFSQGFFNVSVAHEANFGADGQEIEIFCGDADQPILGIINRRANTNGTPRIMGGTALKAFFQGAMAVRQKISVVVLSSTAIRIGPLLDDPVR